MLVTTIVEMNFLYICLGSEKPRYIFSSERINTVHLHILDAQQYGQTYQEITLPEDHRVDIMGMNVRIDNTLYIRSDLKLRDIEHYPHIQSLKRIGNAKGYERCTNHSGCGISKCRNTKSVELARINPLLTEGFRMTSNEVLLSHVEILPSEHAAKVHMFIGGIAHLVWIRIRGDIFSRAVMSFTESLRPILLLDDGSIIISKVWAGMRVDDLFTTYTTTYPGIWVPEILGIGLLGVYVTILTRDGVYIMRESGLPGDKLLISGVRSTSDIVMLKTK